MATIPERLAVLETEVAAVKAVTSETKTDVKQLLAWRDEERGAVVAAKRLHDGLELARARRIKQIGVLLGVLTIGVNVLFKVVG